MEPKPGTDEASKDPGALTTHHSYTDQDFEGENLPLGQPARSTCDCGQLTNYFHPLLLPPSPKQDIVNMPCMLASTFQAAGTEDAVTIIDAITTITRATTEQLAAKMAPSEKGTLSRTDLVSTSGCCCSSPCCCYSWWFV